MSKGPSHYQRGSIEVWDFIRDQQLNYHLGNAIKYICRAGFKDSKADDLAKAIHYLENEYKHTLAALAETKPDGSSGGIPNSLLFMGEGDFCAGDPEGFDR